MTWRSLGPGVRQAKGSALGRRARIVVAPLMVGLAVIVILTASDAGGRIGAARPAVLTTPTSKVDNATPPPSMVLAPVAAPPRTTTTTMAPGTEVTVPAPTEAAAKTTAAAVSPAEACATALAYLAANAKPGFAHYCRPGALLVDGDPVAAYTCVPGSSFTCPDGVAEIIIAAPACALSYQNEASNSYWDFSAARTIRPGVTQHGRTWDPFGACP